MLFQRLDQISFIAMLVGGILILVGSLFSTLAATIGAFLFLFGAILDLLLLQTRK